MPFVPIGSRKPYTLLLDHDKVLHDLNSFMEPAARSGSGLRCSRKMRRWWRSTMALHPSARGYRFGNHPMTRGPVRRGRSQDVPLCQGAGRAV